MLFRRKEKKVVSPIVTDDGKIFVQVGEKYDSDEYETDSDYESEEDMILDENELKQSLRNLDDQTAGSSNNLTELTKDDGDSNSHLVGKKLNHDSNSCDLSNTDVGSNEASTNNTQIDHYEATIVSSEVIEDEPTETHKNGEEATETHETEEEEPETHETKEDAPESSNSITVHDRKLNLNDGFENLNQITLMPIGEKRYLLALAAEHDRVDIIKAILQPKGSYQEETMKNPLIQLLLNNRILAGSKVDNTSLDSYTFGDKDLEPNFIPPLHISIASSSVNSASCLLRMGADPSIRPVISYSSAKAPVNIAHNLSDDPKKDWSMLDGFSAFELVFGTPTHEQRVNHEKNKNMIENEAEKSWFGWIPVNGGNANKSSIVKDSSEVKILPSKMEGLKHAFFAEALRAIGSDEEDRLIELLNSGLDIIFRPDSEFDIMAYLGDKSLLCWCKDLGATKCLQMIKQKYNIEDKAAHSESDVGSENVNEEARVVESDAETTLNLSDNVEKCPVSKGTNNDTPVEVIKKKLEEMDSLSNDLSKIYDTLTKEVSMTKDLLLYSDGSYNSALVSQVRLLKEERSNKQAEISKWQTLISDREAELSMVKMWLQNQGVYEVDFESIFFDEARSQIDQKVSAKNIENISGQSTSEFDAQLSLSENKIKRLQESIEALAEQNMQNLKRLEKLGLSGAVKLTRTLQDELADLDNTLQDLEYKEANLRMQLKVIRGELDRKMVDRSSNVESPKCSEKEEEIDNHLQAAGNDHQTSTSNITTENLQIKDGTSNDLNENQIIPQRPIKVEVINKNDEDIKTKESSIVSTNDDPCERDTKSIIGSVYDQPSTKIQNGESTEIIKRVEGAYKNHLPIHIWRLILRIVGIGRTAVRKTVRVSGLGNPKTNPHILIV